MAAGAAWAASGKEPSVPESVVAATPGAGDLEEFSGTRIFFGHQSVGSNVIAGAADLYADAGNAALIVVETRDEVPASGGFLAHAHVGVNGEPLGKIQDFARIVSGPMGDQVDVAVLKLCYDDIVEGTDVQAVFDEYSATMTRLESEHPGVSFVYTTVPLTTDRGWKQVVKSWIGRADRMGPSDNLARERYNALIRERYGDSGRLFDIAAVESTMNTTPMSRTQDGQTFYVLHPGLASDPGHLNEIGSRAAASELIRVVTAAR